MKNLKLFDLQFVCPDLKTQNDEMEVRSALESMPGIEAVEIDLATHTLRVVCAGDAGEREVRTFLSNAGFPPEG